MLIGTFGFYQNWLPLFELRITPWRAHLKHANKPGTIPDPKERAHLDDRWTQEDDCMLDDLKETILKGPVLTNPDFSRGFYLKIDWCKDGPGAALCQADDSDEARTAEEQQEKGGKCLFDKTFSGLQLRPTIFISRATTKSEKSMHLSLGEPCTVVWAIEKFSHILRIKEFTLLSDMIAMKEFLESPILPTHQVARWKQQLMRYWLTVEHRPDHMMAECNLLSIYDRVTTEWRINPQEPDEPVKRLPKPATDPKPKTDPQANLTFLSEA
eukprot:scaffold365638_cov35-Attheya_sp.AAC.1